MPQTTPPLPGGLVPGLVVVGQPWLSVAPGCPGQESSGSFTPSACVSRTEQPWLVEGPDWVGQESSGSFTPSPSVSTGTGHPSTLPLPVSLGQPSAPSITPSPSESGFLGLVPWGISTSFSTPSPSMSVSQASPT